jgi:hypothetical protein
LRAPQTEDFWEFATRAHSKHADAFADFLRLMSKGVVARPTRQPNSAAQLRLILERERIDIPSETSGRIWQSFQQYLIARSVAAER